MITILVSRCFNGILICMLSPASLRVCCLAVMAPALTKADRRADCLPVVLSDPFCESKTVTPYNRKDKYIEAHLPKLSSKFACLLNNRRKAYIHKTWFRTHLKNNSPEFCYRSPCPPADLHNSKHSGESNHESWHGTSVTLAVADKVRLKYTMSKNNSSTKNMGLTRTNASLGLHSMKKVNRITQFSPRDKGNFLTPSVRENSPDLPDSTNSELDTGLTITRIVESEAELPGDVSSSSGKSDMITTTEPVSISEGDIALTVSCAGTVAEAPPKNHSIMSCFSNINSISTSKDSNVHVPVTLTGSECTVISSANPAEIDALLPHPATAGQSNSFPSLHASPCIHSAQSHPSCPDVSTDVLTEKSSDIAQPTDSSLTLESKVSSSQSLYVEPDFENLHFQPEDFLNSSRPPCSMGVRTQSSAASTAQLTLKDAIIKSKLNRYKVPLNKNCCSLSDDSNVLLNQKYSQGMKRILAAVEKSELLIRICISAYSKREIGELINSYQKKLGIPCQKQLKRNFKPVKDVVDLKAELLQSEDVKSLSTAALVNLVRKLESSGSPGNLLPSQNVSSVADASLSETAALAFSPEDVADVIHTSRELLTSIKNELKYVDPDLTESSDEGESDLESPEHESDHKMALWKFMKDRAALTCRSTWLIARIHELENQLRTAVGALQKVSSSLESIGFEDELTVSESTAALSTAGSDDACAQSVSKPKVKGFNKPVNGYLDHNPMSNIAHIGHNTCSVENLRLSEEQFKTDLTMTYQQCSRTRALKASAFQKRDTLVTSGLHLTNSKLSKLSTIDCHCNCQDEVMPCVLCMGRYQCNQSVDPDSMPLLDRVSLLDSNFHPLLSFHKDIPLTLHFENILKKNESQYQVVRPVSPTPSIKRFDFGTKPKHFTIAQSRSRKLSNYARTLSEKYRNKHLRNNKRFRKHRMVFGKWRKFQNRTSFQARDRFRRLSVESSGSSHDSPIPSPGSVFEEGLDNLRKRQDNQFDIDDVIIPYSNKSVRLVEFEFKDIIVPSFRIDGNDLQDIGKPDPTDILFKELYQAEEGTYDEVYLTRHESLEVEEKKINRRPSVLNLLPVTKRSRREHRFDSRADSSGANTPDPLHFCEQDMFQDHSSMTAPTPPALSPPTTPSSANLVSDDSQPSFGSTLSSRLERKKITPLKRPSEENNTMKLFVDNEEITPYETRTFPLSNEQFEEIAMDPYGEDLELTVSGPSSPASPGSTTMSTSTIEDITDPEWMVLNNNPAHEPGLKLKLAKR